MKKIFCKVISIVLCVILLLNIVPLNLTIFADETDTNNTEYFNYTISNGEASIKSINQKNLTHIDIPSHIDNYPVTKLETSLLDNNRSCVSINLPSTIKLISKNTFFVCSSLKDVYYNGDIYDWIKIKFENLESTPLNQNATIHFATTPNEEFIVPDDIEKIPDYALYKVKCLKRITIPATVKEVGINALFEATDGDYEINYLGALEEWCKIKFSSIKDNKKYSTLFINGKKVTSLTIPDSITSIGDYAFMNVKSIKNVELHDNITNIGKNAFKNTAWYLNEDNWDLYDILYCGDYLIRVRNDVRLTKIKETTKLIGQYAYAACYNLISVDIPDSVKIINDHAFYDCTGIDTLNIGDGVTYYGTIFEDCYNVLYVKIGKGKTSIKNDEFLPCLYLKTVELPDTIKSIGSYAFFWCDGLTKINLPEGLERIGSYAFWGVESKIVIPRSVKYIGNSAFTTDKVYGYKGSYAESFFSNSSSKIFVDVESCEYLGHIGESCINSVVCERCGENTPITPNKHHNVQTTPGIPSTCCSTGITQGLYCNDCNTQLSPQKDIRISKNSHINIEICDGTEATCLEDGYSAGIRCTGCDLWLTGHRVIEKAKGHTEKLYITKPATLTKDGTMIYKCSVCDLELSSSITIFKPYLNFSLSKDVYRYDGKVKTPTVKVNHLSGVQLIENKDYTVTYYSDRKNVGKYKVKVTLIGEYSGTKTLYFNIIRNLSAPKTLSVKLSAHDDVKLNWSKVPNADCYDVYYKKDSAKSYTYYGSPVYPFTYITNLQDGVKYIFKVVPCTNLNDSHYADDSYKTASITTLKKISTPTVKKHSSSKIKVQWDNISGESGYQISKSTSKSKKGKLYNYSTTTGKSKIITAIKGKTYYYKIRAYKKIDGKKIYGPWSNVKSYKLK